MKKLILMSLVACSLIASNCYAGDIKSLGTFKLTWYCPCKKCSGKWGHQTSSGAYATEGRTVAVDKDVIKSGTHLMIDGHEYVAEDTGGGVKGNHIDIFLESHKECLDNDHGEKYKEVFIILDQKE